MGRPGVLQVELGPELYAQIKREAVKLGLKTGAYARMLLINRKDQLALDFRPKKRAK